MEKLKMIIKKSKLPLSFVIISLFFIFFTSEKPLVGGDGNFVFEVAKEINLLPWYHAFPDEWRAMHMEKIGNRKVKKENCLICHYDPEKFCYRCHNYVGVKKVIFKDKKPFKFEGLDSDPPEDHVPIEKWRVLHDNTIISGKNSIKDHCLTCHFDPDNFCNICHSSINVRKIMN